MPIYEYKCQACAYEFECLQKLSDGPLTDCPQCQASSLVKKISAAGFRLSGSGWYETDFKKGDKQKNLAGERDAAKSTSDGAKTESGKSDGGTKPGKPETKPDKPATKPAPAKD